MSCNGLKMRRNRGVKCAVLVENCDTVAGSWSQERERKRGERNFGWIINSSSESNFKNWGQLLLLLLLLFPFQLKSFQNLSHDSCVNSSSSSHKKRPLSSLPSRLAAAAAATAVTAATQKRTSEQLSTATADQASFGAAISSLAAQGQTESRPPPPPKRSCQEQTSPPALNVSKPNTIFFRGKLSPFASKWNQFKRNQNALAYQTLSRKAPSLLQQLTDRLPQPKTWY